MPKIKSTITLLLIGIASFAFLFQLPIKNVSANGITTPAPGVSYTWDVLSTNGKVWWFNTTPPYGGDEGNKTLMKGGTIQYDLTGQYPNNALWTDVTGSVWFGNFTIYHNVSTTQVLNWTKANCSTTEIGSNLILSALNWQGGLIAQTNWTKNYVTINNQLFDMLSYQVDSGTTALIDYWYSGQATHLEYSMATGVLIYARTSYGDYQMEIALKGIDFIPKAKIFANASTFVEGSPAQFFDGSYLGTRPFT
nr:hypothetical protein [Candidatus Sigynarchaeota archaeon]